MTDLREIGIEMTNDAEGHRAAMQEDEFELVASRAGQAFAQIAGYADLSPLEKNLLYEALIKAKHHFDLRQDYTDSPSNKAAADRIGKIRHAAHMLAQFSLETIGSERLKEDGNPETGATTTGEKALRMLCKVDGELAGLASQEDLDFMHAFLRAAPRFKKIVDLATANPQPTKGKFGQTPHQSLIGTDLPEIYKKFFEDFTATPKTDFGEASPGVLFIRAAMFVLGVPDAADNTILKHCNAAKPERERRKSLLRAL